MYKEQNKKHINWEKVGYAALGVSIGLGVGYLLGVKDGYHDGILSYKQTILAWSNELVEDGILHFMNPSTMREMVSSKEVNDFLKAYNRANGWS